MLLAGGIVALDMHIAETFGPQDDIPNTKVMTFEGEARSGKGTSVRAVHDALVAEGRSVMIIDQGQKFRTLARVGMDFGVNLANPAAVSEFLDAPETRPAMLDMLASVGEMNDEGVNNLLYTSEVGAASAQVGENAKSHPLAVGLLFDQVRHAVLRGVDTVLVDGRCMEKYGRQIAEQKIAQFALGFFFRCDASIAARRTTGIFVDMDAMSVDEKLRLLEEITKISDRNRKDTLREVDPMREPAYAHPLHTAEFDAENPGFIHVATLDAMGAGMVTINTSYTRSVAEMTDPVRAIATHAIALHDEELERFQRDPSLWGGFEAFGDPRRLSVVRSGM